MIYTVPDPAGAPLSTSRTTTLQYCAEQTGQRTETDVSHIGGRIPLGKGGD
jgi:hypothetical protein